LLRKTFSLSSNPTLFQALIDINNTNKAKKKLGKLLLLTLPLLKTIFYKKKFFYSERCETEYAYNIAYPLTLQKETFRIFPNKIQHFML